MQNHVLASSFADPADVRAFERCKAEGNSDQECFKIGDNGIGAWGDVTKEGSGPSCALPPEVLIQNYGTVDAGHLQCVKVTRGQLSVDCLIKDIMPHIANIHNGARIDLNPDAVRALGLEPPILTYVIWEKA